MHEVGGHRSPIVATVGKQAPRMRTWRTTGARCSQTPRQEAQGRFNHQPGGGRDASANEHEARGFGCRVTGMRRSQKTKGGIEVVARDEDVVLILIGARSWA